ncbi:MAG: hypothetical protein ONB23_03040 [candidate division KSB1 bacterium]|nr:hypothetical protein [candidate division KSB1 bacterium]
MQTVERISPYVSLGSLAAIVVFASLHLTGNASFRVYLVATNVLSAVWFLTAPLWLLPKKDSGGLP